MARYNDSGKEVIVPISYCDDDRSIMNLEIENKTNIMTFTEKDTKLDLHPCDEFRFLVSKNDDFDIDIYLHVNPKHILENIPAMLLDLLANL